MTIRAGNDYMKGGCLCWVIRYEVEGDPQLVVHCHCAMCRRHSGAAFLTYASWQIERVRFSSEGLVQYRSSENAVRGHCGKCGSPITFAFDSDPTTLWLTAGSFDCPDKLRPAEHWFVNSRMPWLHLKDGLPEWPKLPQA